MEDSRELRLLKASRRIREMCGGDVFDRFETVATLFRQETGYMRPGKDVPAAGGHEDDPGVRQRAFDAWWTRQFEEFYAAVAAYED